MNGSQKTLNGKMLAASFHQSIQLSEQSLPCLREFTTGFSWLFLSLSQRLILSPGSPLLGERGSASHLASQLDIQPSPASPVQREASDHALQVHSF